MWTDLFTQHFIYTLFFITFINFQNIKWWTKYKKKIILNVIYHSQKLTELYSPFCVFYTISRIHYILFRKLLSIRHSQLFHIPNCSVHSSASLKRWCKILSSSKLKYRVILSLEAPNYCGNAEHRKMQVTGRVQYIAVGGEGVHAVFHRLLFQ